MMVSSATEAPELPWGQTAPSFPKGLYSPEESLGDISALVYALHAFLASHMVESEDYCRRYDPKMCANPCRSFWVCLLNVCRERLYFATGYGLIQCFKGMISFEDDVCIHSIYSCCDLHASQDLLSALNHVRHGNAIASQHRKRAASLPTRLAGLLVGSLNTSGVGFIKSMTPVERHAELVYAESLLEKVERSAMNIRILSDLY